MPGTKVLLPWRGQPLIRHLAGVALASRLDELLVVVGHRADEVGAALADLPLRTVYNPHYERGQSTSLRAGIAALPEQCAGVLIMLADQPLLTSHVIDELLGVFWNSGAVIVAACANGRRGNPVLFARTLFPELMQATGDQGARAVITAHRADLRCLEVNPEIFADIDTPEAYAALHQS